ncbi:hypothetical protein IE53DRAFT_367230 [Violaceomyces palustris]|uniref:Uncharacterized protein n=1 Tax=Violaceomyces palustris TaxID=1673888 RepID=A0ACD0P2T8_9BASI|nr:hypothetical protein IE53DRAFT_367230 [Violaceomyces palustris]
MPPFSYQPLRLAFAPLSSLNRSTPPGSDPIPQAVPTPNHPAFEDFPARSLPPHHAAHAKAYFPSSAHHPKAGFALARAIEDGTDSPPPRTFIFPAPILPNLGLFADTLSGSLHVVAVTVTGFLYRLSFPLPFLFHTESFPANWSEEYRINALAAGDVGPKARVATEVHVADGGLVLVACGDGVVIKLQQARAADGGFEGPWRESTLRPSSFLSGVSRFFSRSASPSVSSTSIEASSSPTHALAMASHLNANGSAFAFVASRDRKLRIWSMVSETCVRTLDLPTFLSSSGQAGRELTTSTAAEDEIGEQVNSKEGIAPFGAGARPLLRLFYPGDDDISGYHAYLLVFIPAPLPSGNFFVLYGIELEESRSASGGVGEVQLLWQKRCDPETRGGGLELRDIAVMPLEGDPQTGWTMWTLWDSGNGAVVKYVRVGDEVEGSAESPHVTTFPAGFSEKWKTVAYEDLFRPLHGPEFEADLEASRDASDPTHFFLSRILEAGRFSISSIRSALESYKDDLPSSSRTIQATFSDLYEEVSAVVGSNCQLEVDSSTGNYLYDRLHASIVREWMRFLGLLEQVEVSARWPLELATPELDFTLKQGSGAPLAPMVVMRDMIALPVFEDLVSTIERLERTVQTASERGKVSSAQRAREMATWERRLLLADTKIDSIGANPPSKKEGLLRVAMAASKVCSGLTSSDFEEFILAFSRAMSEPLNGSFEEEAELLWSQTLEESLDTEAYAELEQVCSDLGEDLEEALRRLGDLLEGDRKAPVDFSHSSDLAESDLGSALIANTLTQSISSRHTLATRFTILLVGLLTSTDNASVLADLPTFIARAFANLQSLNGLKDLARLSGVPEMAISEIDDAQDLKAADSIADRLGKMSVGSVAGGRSRSKNGAETILHFCIQNHLLPLERRSHSGSSLGEGSTLPINTWVFEAAACCIDDSGLITQSSPGSPCALPYLQPAQSLLAQELFTGGFPSAALTYLSHFPPSPASSYIRARAFVALRRLDEASVAFEQVVPVLESVAKRRQDSDGLLQLLPTSIVKAEGESSVALYYRHVSTYFEAVNAPALVVKFCQAAIEAGDTFAGGEIRDENLDSSCKDLWFRVFRAQLSLGDYDGAYSTIMELPFEVLRKDCLRSLVGVMCESGHVGSLLRFSFPGLQPEIERTLSFKARNSDPLAHPNYYFVLYSYHIFRGDMKSAGAVMYQHAHRLAEFHNYGVRSGSSRVGSSAADEYLDLAVKQAQSYLASINALSLVKPANAWFADAADSPSSQDVYPSFSDADASDSSARRPTGKGRLTNYIPDSQFQAGAREIKIVRLEDVRKEYRLVLARLELVGRYPELANATSTLKPLDAVLLFVNTDRFDEAFSTAKALDVDMTDIFQSLTSKCVALSKARALRKSEAKDSEPLHPEVDELRDADEDMEEPEAAFLNLSEKCATWKGPASERAWRYLRMYLEMFDHSSTGWRYRQAVLDRALALGHSSSLPEWLSKWFMEHKPDFLIRTSMEYGLVDEALRHSIDMVKKDTAERARTSTQAGTMWLPYNLLDELLLQAEDPDTRPSNGSSSATGTRALAAELREVLSSRVLTLEKRTNEVKRMNEADLERERKRRERERGSDWVPSF